MLIVDVGALEHVDMQDRVCGASTRVSVTSMQIDLLCSCGRAELAAWARTHHLGDPLESQADPNIRQIKRYADGTKEP